MRKLLLLLLSLLMLASCRFESDIAPDGNPFLDERDLTKAMVVTGEVEDNVLKAYSVDSTYSGEHWSEGEFVEFALVTDVHIGMADTDKGVKERYEGFLSFIEGKDYPFMVCLGDVVDDGDLYDSRVIDFITTAAGETNGNYVMLIGNHDRRQYSQSVIDSFVSEINNGRMEKLVFDQLSLYKLDNSLRTFGKNQLVYLEEALSEDENPVKLILAHENLIPGSELDTSIFYIGTGDTAERNRVYRIMEENGAGVIFTGHFHTGNIVTEVTDTMGEFNAGSNVDEPAVPGNGYYFTVRVSFTDKEVLITSYDAKTGEKDDEFTYKLP